MGEIAEGVVYSIRCRESGCQYVGSTMDFAGRRRRHLYDLRKGRHHSRYLQRLFDKRGVDGVEFTAIEDGIDEAELLAREAYHIARLTPAFNGAQPGPTRRGAKQTEACKAKVSAANRGRVRTAEFRAALSRTLVGNQRAAGNQSARKVTEAVLERIRTMRAEGLGFRKIAASLGLDKKTIKVNFRGTTWAK